MTSGAVRWGSPEVKLAFTSDERPPSLDEATAGAALEDAARAWSEPACTSAAPTFAAWVEDYSSDSSDWDAAVVWDTEWAARDLPGDSPAVTELSYRQSGGRWQIAEATIYLDATGFVWDQTTLTAVLTHELGHALGLRHPCEDDGSDGAPRCDSVDGAVAGSAMYPFYSKGDLELGTDDIAGICYLYPRGIEGCATSCGPRQKCVDDVCRERCGDEICGEGELCGVWGCAPEGGCTERDCTGVVCRDDEDCGPLLTCAEGNCFSGARRWGDDCAHHRDCADGACVDGVCQPLCFEAVDCKATAICQPAAAGVSGCVHSRAYPTGAGCVDGEDCASGQCVQTHMRSACTISCSSDAQCPESWACDEVQGKRVCVPDSANSGCQLSAARGSPLPHILIMVLGLLVWRSRAKRLITK